MKREELKKYFEKYNLEAEDFFTQKKGKRQFTIITRSGIQKIQHAEKIKVKYEVIKAEPHFACIKAFATLANPKGVVDTSEMLASALYGKGHVNDKGKWEETGTTQSLYVLEIAQKRALSRVVLTLSGLYMEGVFGEDEDFDGTDPRESSGKSTKSDNALKVASDLIK